MHDDDQRIGELLSRRAALRFLGASGALMLAGCQSVAMNTGPGVDAPNPHDAVCIARPAQTEGPFFIDEHLERADIRKDPSDGSLCAGLPLELRMRIGRIAAGRCTPLQGAQVDLWHCNALGQYSDVNAPDFSLRGKKFLRGYQMTDNDGAVRFVTIYPGWYEGRTVHIHFKIRVPGGARSNFDFTSQLYFDDSLNQRVFALRPYAAKGQPDIRNRDDGIYRDGGDQLLLPVTMRNDQGCTANYGVGLVMD